MKNKEIRLVGILLFLIGFSFELAKFLYRNYEIIDKLNSKINFLPLCAIGAFLVCLPNCLKKIENMYIEMNKYVWKKIYSEVLNGCQVYLQNQYKVEHVTAEQKSHDCYYAIYKDFTKYRITVNRRFMEHNLYDEYVAEGFISDLKCIIFWCENKCVDSLEKKVIKKIISLCEGIIRNDIVIAPKNRSELCVCFLKLKKLKRKFLGSDNNLDILLNLVLQKEEYKQILKDFNKNRIILEDEGHVKANKSNRLEFYVQFSSYMMHIKPDFVPFMRYLSYMGGYTNDLKKRLLSTSVEVDLEEMRKFIIATQLYRKVIVGNEFEDEVEYISLVETVSEMVRVIDILAAAFSKYNGR